MFKAIGQFFTAMFVTFSAIEKSAKALDHLAGIGEAEADGLAQTMRLDREARLAELAKQLKAPKSK